MSARFFFLFACAAAVGCGGKTVGTEFDDAGSDAASRDSATPADGNVLIPADGGAVDYCKAIHDRSMRCRGDAITAAECHEQLTCFKNVLRSEVYTPLLTCFANRDCGTSDDRCAEEQARPLLGDPAVQGFTQACNDKRRECVASGSSFADDYCSSSYALFNDPIRTKFRACLAEPCRGIRDCFGAIFDAAGCGK